MWNLAEVVDTGEGALVSRAVVRGGHASRIERLWRESVGHLADLAGRGWDRWIVMFSGGKDSTTVLVLALEAVLQRRLPVRAIEVVYADTMVEIPPVQQGALSFLQALQGMARIRGLPVHVHHVRPSLDNSFWVCLLGKGYPPPHQRFRWCTDRLKVRPVEKQLRDAIEPGRTAILTGVRFGESRARDRRMYSSCKRGGECGHGVWQQHSDRLRAMYAAPIAYWRECDVWDFLNFTAPCCGYPTAWLSELYMGGDIRFGCWMCTVVQQDRAMERIVSQPQWAHLRPLMELRNRIMQEAQEPQNRLMRSDGKKGRLSLDARKRFLHEVLNTQKMAGVPVISDEEVARIRELWQDKRYGNYD